MVRILMEFQWLKVFRLIGGTFSIHKAYWIKANVRGYTPNLYGQKYGTNVPLYVFFEDPEIPLVSYPYFWAFDNHLMCSTTMLPGSKLIPDFDPSTSASSANSWEYGYNHGIPTNPNHWIASG